MSRVDLKKLKAAQKRWGLREVPEGEQCEAAARYAFECDRRASMARVQALVDEAKAKRDERGSEKETDSLIAYLDEQVLRDGVSRDEGGAYRSASVRVDWSRFLVAWNGGVEWAQHPDTEPDPSIEGPPNITVTEGYAPIGDE